MRFFQEVPPENSNVDDIHEQIEEVIATMRGDAVPLPEYAAFQAGDDVDDEGLRAVSVFASRQEEFAERVLTRRERGTWVERHQARTKKLVPIRFAIGEGVPEAEAQAARLGIEDVLKASGQERQLIIATPDTIPPDEYYDSDEQVANASKRQGIHRDLGYGGQIDLQLIFDEIGKAEPYQEPHLDVRMLTNDLTAEIAPGEYLSFAFGATNPREMITVQSIARFMAEIPPGRLREEVIRRLFRHKTGHLLGLPRNDRGHIEQKLGLHCTNVCTMRQGMSVGEWARLTVEEYDSGVHFCRDCQHDLDRTKDNYRPL